MFFETSNKSNPPFYSRARNSASYITTYTTTGPHTHLTKYFPHDDDIRNVYTIHQEES